MAEAERNRAQMAESMMRLQLLHRPENDLVFLRLGPYSPMLNPIEGCFNSLKANIKEMLAERREEIFSQGEFSSLVQRRMNLLYEAAIASLHKISPFLVSRMNMFCVQHWPAAKRMEDMLYGA